MASNAFGKPLFRADCRLTPRTQRQIPYGRNLPYRLVQVTRRLDAKNVVAEYEYDALNRRILKTVTNTGVGDVNRSNDVNGDGTVDADALQAGDKIEHYYYAGWRVIEETDNAAPPHVLAQTVYGTQYIDEPVCRDRNTDALPTSGSPDSDCLDSGGSQRYFYHQDANFRVVLLTDESGAAVERYDYDAYGEPRIWACGTGVSPVESGSLLRVSRVGNPLMHQGLRRDDETGLHENRYRTLHSRLGRFMQRDPLGYADSSNLYSYLGGDTISQLDPLGDSVISWIAKKLGVKGLKNAILEWLRQRVIDRLKGLLKRNAPEAAEIQNLIDEIMSILSAESSWWEFVLELVPGIGDIKSIWSESKRFQKIRRLLEKLEDRVEKWIKKLRQKAVTKFWEKERDRLKKGERPSREWTPEQRKDILDGKTPMDDQGRPFVGHHDKCVKDHPELADDPDNIIPVTFDEHVKIHGAPPEDVFPNTGVRM